MFPESKKLHMSEEPEFRFGKRVDHFEPTEKPRRPERL